MAEEVEENIKVVVRVRDLIAREKDQPKVIHSVRKPKYFCHDKLFSGLYGCGCDRNHPEGHE